VVPRLAPAGTETSATVSPGFVEEIFGAPRFLREARLTTASTGVVTGLAWTSVGGEIMHIEALRFEGKGNIQLTGQIGSVMKESAQAALSLLKSRATGLGLNLDQLLDSDIHVHVPAGAVPKDGPSAGAAIFTAMVSLWTGRTVRADVAMTGELTLRGLILPIGGLKEKILAAQRAGIPTVILPRLNEKDLTEVPATVRDTMKFILVETADEVLAAALNPGRPPVKHRKRSIRA
jgi:ATP-dependent Lon protease